MLIDFGVAQTGSRHAGFLCTPEQCPQTPPELCLHRTIQVGGMGITMGMHNYALANIQYYAHPPGPLKPHPTSDMHGVAYVISTISKHLNMVSLFKHMDVFMRYEPGKRQYDYLERCVEIHFNKLIQANNQDSSFKPS